MTPEQIRDTHLGKSCGVTEDWQYQDFICRMLREIAAQLADLNERMEPGNLQVNVEP